MLHSLFLRADKARYHTAARENEWFSVYDFSNYDDYKYWPKTWKQRKADDQ